MNFEIDENLKIDPDNKGWVLGWAVLTTSPWHLAGVYASKQKAEATCPEGYKVEYGSHRLGSDDFTYGATNEDN
ncbi:hypothetical protein [Vreelandella aquamarina]|uniref:Uncharacterized protein n=1 Tax=Vreelandella aquamarina TaxID=77097 RepID=A0A857GGV3_9GAMM|nr:hypothetical protein [Halomonas meridiana]QHD48492.1 hypothetical protein CTT34_01650 [Halomonas meridiana]